MDADVALEFKYIKEDIRDINDKITIINNNMVSMSNAQTILTEKLRQLNLKLINTRNNI